MKLRVNANQDVHHLTQKSSSILQITSFKLKHVINFNFKMYMSRVTKTKGQVIATLKNLMNSLQRIDISEL